MWKCADNSIQITTNNNQLLIQFQCKTLDWLFNFLLVFSVHILNTYAVRLNLCVHSVLYYGINNSIWHSLWTYKIQAAQNRIERFVDQLSSGNFEIFRNQSEWFFFSPNDLITLNNNIYSMNVSSDLNVLNLRRPWFFVWFQLVSNHDRIALFR